MTKSKTKKQKQKKRNPQKLTRKQQLKKLSCSPLVSETINDNSCYDSKNIYNLKNLWNLRHPESKIQTNNPQEIWQFFKNTFNNVCDNERCWMKQEFAKNNLNKNTMSYLFAPKAPKSWSLNKNEWLSNYDIMKVMTQYEIKHPNFKFIGPTPIDFDKITNNNECVWNELCKFDLSKYINNNIDYIGVVFNTDPSHKSGEHWVSMFINLNPKNDYDNKPYIFYFDSAGNKIPNEITKLKNRIMDMATKLNKPLTFIENYPLQHQKSSTECGMYSLCFILKLLYGEDTRYFLDKNNLITDKYVENYRTKYFNFI